MKRLQSIPLNDRNGIHAAPEPNATADHLPDSQGRAATIDDVVRELREIRVSLAAGQPEFVDVDAAAALLGVSRAT